MHNASRSWLEMMDTVPETPAWEAARTRMHRAYDAYHIALTLAGYKIGVHHAGDTVIIRKSYDWLLLSRLTERAVMIHDFSTAEIEGLYAHQQEFEGALHNDDNTKSNKRHTTESLPDWKPFTFGAG